ncbi:rhodanese-like domain-containing protein [soil metagenome]
MARRSIGDLLAKARSRYRRLSPLEAQAAARDGAVVVDTRCREALDSDGRIPGALHVPLSVLPWRADPDSPHRDERIARLDARLILVCSHGFSSSLAVASLLDLGFSEATDIDGGFEAWRDAGLPVTSADR